MSYIPLTVYRNLPQTTVTAGGTTAPASGTGETWTVAASGSFPPVTFGAQQCHVSDPAANSELITVTSINGNTWTVTRGAEGTTPVSHSAGFTVIQVVSAQDLANLEYPPWQFPVAAYGAVGDGKIGTGGTGTSGTATFTDAGAAFVNAAAPQGDVGKFIIINQGAGGSATNPFAGTILAVNSATSVTLSANLGANCSAAPYIYGTDDAGAINSAVSAAAQWAVSTGNYKCQVVFQPANYMLGGLTQSTSFNWSFNSGPYTYNTHIPLPFTGQFARKLIIDLIGVGDATEPDFWGSTVPSVQGTCLVSCVSATSQPNVTFGQQSIIGVPSVQTNIGNGGISGGNFANVLVNVDGVTVVAPWNSQQYGFDFRFAAQANVINGSYLAFAPVNAAAQVVGGPYLSSSNIVSNGVSTALAMPVVGNNDNCNVDVFTVEGAAVGCSFGEHFTAHRIGTLYCDVGLFPGVNAIMHGGSILYWTCEACNTGLKTNASASNQMELDILNADFEVINTFYVNDPNSNLTGTLNWFDISHYTPDAGAGISGATRYNIVNCYMNPGVWAANANLSIAGPPAAPGNGVPQKNSSWRPAVVYATATGSITAIAVGPLSGSLTSIAVSAGAGVAVPVRVAAGHWYSVTYTGTLTTTWVLE